jgi:transcriptional regulator with XRE-family HTH domain
MLMIGERLRTIRESKNLSQGDIEKRTGLFRCYTSRVENGHTVPSIETLAKYAQALEIHLYQIFYDGEEGSNEDQRGRPRRGQAVSQRATRD